MHMRDFIKAQDDCEKQLVNSTYLDCEASSDCNASARQRTVSPDQTAQDCAEETVITPGGHTKLLEPGEDQRDVRKNSKTMSTLALRRPSVTSSTDTDALKCLSVVSATSKEFGHEASHGSNSPKSGFPLPLMGLVTVLASVAGFVVVGFSTAIIHAGCPLGINGCNEFYNKEDKGFKLIKALEDVVPEEIVYIVVAALGALVVIQFITRLPAEFAFQICGGGTIQSLEAVAVGYVIPLPVAGLRLLCSVIYSGSGGPLGMEGPIIQICTVLATNTGWVLGIRAAPTQSVLASLGFACGFAASFNSPLAGILFVVEEMRHVMPHFSRGMEVMVLVASIAPVVVYRACKGNKQHFYPRYGDEIVQGTKGGSLDRVFGEQLWMLIAIPIAMLCCLVNLAIILALRHLNAASEILHRRFECLPITVTFVLHAIVVACIGVAVFHITGLRGIWGIGAESVQKALTEDFEIHKYFVFGFAKCLVMVIAVVVRAPGDVLEPVLITGAFLGGGIGRCLVVWFGLGVEVMTPSIIFGMVGLFASCFRFTLTPVVIVIELMGTEAYALIIPMVLSSFTAVILSSRLCCPILAEIMRQDEIDLHGGHGTEPEEDLEEEKTGYPSQNTEECSLGSNKGSVFRTALGGMFAEELNSLAVKDGLSHDYDLPRQDWTHADNGFSRQESPESNNSGMVSVPPVSPKSPRSAWTAEPASPKYQKRGVPRRKLKANAAGSNEQEATAVSFLRRQKTGDISAHAKQDSQSDTAGAPEESDKKQETTVAAFTPPEDPGEGG